MGLIFLYLSIALTISFLCSLLEAILLSTPASFITMKESQGVRGSLLLKELKTNIDRPISAILSLNTVAHTIGAAGVGAEAVKIFGDEYFGVISAVLTILILVLSEIIPKTIGATYWQRLAIPAAKVIQGMIFICYPLVRLSELLTDAIDNKDNDVLVNREEVISMIDAGIKEGVISKRGDNGEVEIKDSPAPLKAGLSAFSTEDCPTSGQPPGISWTEKLRFSPLFHSS